MVLSGGCTCPCDGTANKANSRMSPIFDFPRMIPPVFVPFFSTGRPSIPLAPAVSDLSRTSIAPSAHETTPYTARGTNKAVDPGVARVVIHFPGGGTNHHLACNTSRRIDPRGYFPVGGT